MNAPTLYRLTSAPEIILILLLSKITEFLQVAIQE